MIKCIIFDFDDTLSDFQLCKERAKETITPRLNALQIDTVSYWKEYESRFEALFTKYIRHELTVDEYRLQRFEHHGINRETAGEYNEIYLNIVHKALLFDDVIPTLSKLKEAGYPVYVLTNGPESQRQKIESCQAGKYIDKIYISSEMGVGKPDPHVYDIILEESSLQPEEILMVGDSYENDCTAAEKCGITAVQIVRRNKIIKDYKHQITSLDGIFSYLTL